MQLLPAPAAARHDISTLQNKLDPCCSALADAVVALYEQSTSPPAKAYVNEVVS